jgi:hypothetical protein
MIAIILVLVLGTAHASACVLEDPEPREHRGRHARASRANGPQNSSSRPRQTLRVVPRADVKLGVRLALQIPDWYHVQVLSALCVRVVEEDSE